MAIRNPFDLEKDNEYTGSSFFASQGQQYQPPAPQPYTPATSTQTPQPTPFSFATNPASAYDQPTQPPGGGTATSGQGYWGTSPYGAGQGNTFSASSGQSQPGYDERGGSVMGTSQYQDMLSGRTTTPSYTGDDRAFRDQSQAAIEADRRARELATQLRNAGHQVRWQGDQLMVDGRPYMVNAPGAGQTFAQATQTDQGQTGQTGLEAPSGAYTPPPGATPPRAPQAMQMDQGQTGQTGPEAPSGPYTPPAPSPGGGALPAWMTEDAKKQINAWYREYLGRDANPGDYAQHAQNPAGLQGVLGAIMLSPEATAFKNRPAVTPPGTNTPAGTWAGGGTPFTGTQGPNTLAGFNTQRAFAGGDPRSVKDAFARAAAGVTTNLQGLTKDQIAEVIRTQIVPKLQAAGIEVQDVQGDKILVKTNERGFEWVDVVQNAGGQGPTPFQWLPDAENQAARAMGGPTGAPGPGGPGTAGTAGTAGAAGVTTGGSGGPPSGDIQGAFANVQSRISPGASREEMEAAIRASFSGVPGFEDVYKESVKINGRWYDLVGNYGGANPTWQLMPKDGGGTPTMVTGGNDYRPVPGAAAVQTGTSGGPGVMTPPTGAPGDTGTGALATGTTPPGGGIPGIPGTTYQPYVPGNIPGITGVPGYQDILSDMERYGPSSQLQQPVADAYSWMLQNPESLGPRERATMQAASREEASQMAQTANEELRSGAYARGIQGSPWMAAEEGRTNRARDESIIASNRGIDIEAARTNTADRRAAAEAASKYMFTAQGMRQNQVAAAANQSIQKVAAEGNRLALQEQVKQEAARLGLSRDQLLTSWLTAQMQDATSRYGIDVEKELRNRGMDIDLQKLAQASEEFKLDLALRWAQLMYGTGLGYGQLQLDAARLDFDRQRHLVP